MGLRDKGKGALLEMVVVGWRQVGPNREGSHWSRRRAGLQKMKRMSVVGTGFGSLRSAVCSLQRFLFVSDRASCMEIERYLGVDGVEMGVEVVFLGGFVFVMLSPETGKSLELLDRLDFRLSKSLQSVIIF